MGEYIKLKELANIISEKIENELKKIKETIKIACLIAGNDPSSLSYMRGMKKRAEKLGMVIEIIQLEESITNENFLEQINKLNNNNEYSGIIIQVPLPKQINKHSIAECLNYKKDIDGISPYNQGLLFSGNPFMIPATAFAVDVTLDYIAKKYNLELKGKNAVIIGRSLTVGKPTLHLLLNKNITPTVVHTKTLDTQKITSNADILIASCGIPELIDEKWIKKGAVIIDVGIHSLDTDDEKGYRLCGDVNSNSALKKASLLTAVPGGIGTVTSTLLFANALKCYKLLKNNEKINFNFI